MASKVFKFCTVRRADDFTCKVEIAKILRESNKRQYGYGCPFIVIFVLTLNLILVALVFLVAYFNYQDAHLPPQTLLEDVSVYCEDLSMSPDDDDETFDTQTKDFKVSIDDDGRYICSYSNTDIKWVTDKMLERRVRLRSAKGQDGSPYLSCGNGTLAPKSGHLTTAFSGVSRHQNLKGEAKDAILHWDKHPVWSYINPDLYYHNGVITIPESRTYYVYASAQFRIPKPKSKTRFIFSIRICRKTYDYEDVLLGDIKEFDAQGEDGVSSLRIGSYLQMTRGDTIYVKVSDASALVRESRGNTFGMFPLH